MGLSYCHTSVQAKPGASVTGTGSAGIDCSVVPSCLIKALGQFRLLRSKTRLKVLSDPAPSTDHKSPNTGAGSPGRPVGLEHLRHKRGCELHDSRNCLSSVLNSLSNERTNRQRSTIRAAGIAETTTPAFVCCHAGNLPNVNYVLCFLL